MLDAGTAGTTNLGRVVLVINITQAVLTALCHHDAARRQPG